MPGLGKQLDRTPANREERWSAYICAVSGGDTNAFGKLYDESAAVLFGLALRILGEPADAEEILLEVFEQVWRSAKKFDPARGSAWGWLAMLTRCRATDRLRSAAARFDKEKLSIDEDWEISSEDPLPDDRMIFRQERVMITNAMGMLRSEQRQAIELAFYMGLTHMEIAAKLGVPLGTIKTRIRAGMEQLRTCLRDSGLTETRSGR